MTAALVLPLPMLSPSVAPATSPVISPATTPPQARRSRKKTWLALHFPDWPLHAAMRTLARERRASLAQQPVAVLDQDRQCRVLAVNAVALAQGVRVGHTLNAALALCTQLQLLPRNMVAENKLLIELAAWAQGYTPLVSMEPPNELLLEVRGSLRLFGGVTSLLGHIRLSLQQRQLAASMALSPTPRASLCLARGHGGMRDAERATVAMPMQLKTCLSGLPLGCLHWPMDIEMRLARFGITRLGELWRLPRADLARRIGVRYLHELDALLGRRVELRRSFRAVPVYRDRIVLEFEICSTNFLEQVLSPALHRLQRYLREHDFSLARLHIELRHREQAATRLCIGLATPAAGMQRVAALLHEQLNRLMLPAPVLEINVHVKQLFAAQATAADLLADVTHSRPAQAQTELLGRLLERLQVRLGANAIYSLQMHADHRPECAQKMQPVSLKMESAGGNVSAPTTRPLWLLSEPLLLGNDVKPPPELQFLQGPERIEAGWWDDAPVKRDYYVARHGNQSCCWVFRDLLQSSAWYVHGWFG